MRKQILIGALFGAMLLPSLVVAQAPAAPVAAKCPAAVAPVNEALKQTAENLSQLVDQIDVIEARIRTYYEGTAAPAGQTLPDFPVLSGEVQRTRQAALTESSQLTSLELRCAPNPAASLARLNQEVGQATTALRNYRAAVRTELLAVRTRVEQALAATPSPTIAPEPERLR